jgi:hypothetical protein
MIPIRGTPLKDAAKFATELQNKQIDELIKLREQQQASAKKTEKK